MKTTGQQAQRYIDETMDKAHESNRGLSLKFLFFTDVHAFMKWISGRRFEEFDET